MAQVTAPLLSFGATGQIGKSIVFATWRGVAYARRLVTPANPNTAAQQETRNTFAWLTSLWKFLPPDVTEGWTAYASGQPLTNRNAWIKLNLPVLTDEADLSNFSFSPAAKSGPVADAVVITPGATQLTVDVTEPSLPEGWSISQCVVAAVRDQDPQSGALYEVDSGVDASTPFQVILTGLTASVLYRVGCWFRYTKPDGSFAYGPALMDSDTPTA